MKHLGILLLGSMAFAGCAQSNTPPAASSETVAEATATPNRGPDFTPAASDGLATSQAERARANSATQPAPNLNPPSDAAAASSRANSGAANAANGNGTWGAGNTAAGVDPTTGNAAAAPVDRSSPEATPPATDADNSRVNKRDKASTALTPTDQGPSEVDRKMTQQIRQELMKDKTLSFTAKNVKIITINGKVTLRGPVKSEAERSAIEAAARRVAGGGALVDSQLELSK